MAPAKTGRTCLHRIKFPALFPPSHFDPNGRSRHSGTAESIESEKLGNIRRFLLSRCKSRQSESSRTAQSPTPTRKSLILHRTPAAALPLPRIRRAPSSRFPENLSRAPVAHARPHQPLPRLLPVAFPPASHCFPVTATPVVRRILHHPRPHRIEIDVGRHRPRRRPALRSRAKRVGGTRII